MCSLHGFSLSDLCFEGHFHLSLFVVSASQTNSYLLFVWRFFMQRSAWRLECPRVSHWEDSQSVRSWAISNKCPFWIRFVLVPYAVSRSSIGISCLIDDSHWFMVFKTTVSDSHQSLRQLGKKFLYLRSVCPVIFSLILSQRSHVVHVSTAARLG